MPDPFRDEEGVAPLFDIGSFAPDADSASSGALQEMDKCLPTKYGIEARPGLRDYSNTASLSSSVLAGFTTQRTDGRVRHFVGTRDLLLEDSAGAWVSLSSASSSTTGTVRWRFTQYNDRTIATNRREPAQTSDTAGFIDLTGSLQCSIVVTVGNFNLGSFLFAFDTNDATNGAQRDRWKCSAVGDPTDFSPSISTLAASGRLTSTPGPITAAQPLGNDVIVYKERGIWIGKFIGPPIIWEFVMISEALGAPSHEAVVNLEDKHIVCGTNNFFEILPGGFIKEIETDLREWFFEEELIASEKFKIMGVHDLLNRRIIWHYSSATAGALDSYVSYCYDAPGKGRWAKGKETVQAIWERKNDPAILQVRSTRNVGVMDSAGQKASITFWDMGIEGKNTFLDTFHPHFKKVPSDGFMTTAFKEEIGDDLESADYTAGLTDSKRFDIMKTGPWHRVRMTTTGTMEVAAIAVNWRFDGEV